MKEVILLITLLPLACFGCFEVDKERFKSRMEYRCLKKPIGGSHTLFLASRSMSCALYALAEGDKLFRRRRDATTFTVTRKNLLLDASPENLQKIHDDDDIIVSLEIDSTLPGLLEAKILEVRKPSVSIEEPHRSRREINNADKQDTTEMLLINFEDDNVEENLYESADNIRFYGDIEETGQQKAMVRLRRAPKKRGTPSKSSRGPKQQKDMHTSTTSTTYKPSPSSVRPSTAPPTKKLSTAGSTTPTPTTKASTPRVTSVTTTATTTTTTTTTTKSTTTAATTMSTTESSASTTKKLDLTSTSPSTTPKPTPKTTTAISVPPKVPGPVTPKPPKTDIIGIGKTMPAVDVKIPQASSVFQWMYLAYASPFIFFFTVVLPCICKFTSLYEKLCCILCKKNGKNK